MYHRNEAFVLRKYDLTESSFVVHFFTREQGIVKLVAKGAKRQRSQFAGLLETLNLLEIEFVRKEHSELGTLRRAELSESSLGLFSDYSTSKLAFAVSEMLSKGVSEGQREEETFRLTRACTGAFREGCPPDWVFNYFVLWFLRLGGVMPPPATCGGCGGVAVAAFDRERGGWLCGECGGGGGFFLSTRSMDAVREMFASPPARLKEKGAEPFPKELKTMLYFNVYHFIGSDLVSLQKG